jgi:hypothetical protein
MKHSPLFTKRRFLKFSLLGVAGAATLVAGAGAYITQTNRYRNRYGQLLVVDGHLADIAHTLAEACVPNRPGFPDIERAEVVKRLDEELFFVSDNISSLWPPVALFKVDGGRAQTSAHGSIRHPGRHAARSHCQPVSHDALVLLRPPVHLGSHWV